MCANLKLRMTRGEVEVVPGLANWHSATGLRQGFPPSEKAWCGCTTRRISNLYAADSSLAFMFLCRPCEFNPYFQLPTLPAIVHPAEDEALQLWKTGNSLASRQPPAKVRYLQCSPTCFPAIAVPTQKPPIHTPARAALVPSRIGRLLHGSCNWQWACCELLY